MVIQKLEMCIEMVKLLIEFAVVFVEAVGTVVCQSRSFLQLLSSTESSNYVILAPYVGLLP
uniref:Uncharacterized protein LOC104234657 n=1 Tax=Nicotiana sylvestris TaxID=4096 RepID=A0A1U7XHZ2_NICSY|nr:PREDICTED: uncharacterized protein LOC104234657 [Nicotiana sylvestris]